MSAQAVLQEARPFLDELEQRLEVAVERYPGLVAVGGPHRGRVGRKTSAAAPRPSDGA